MIDINVTFDNSNNIINLLIKSDSTLKNVWIDTQKTFNCGESNSSSAWHFEITSSTPDTTYYVDEIDGLNTLNYSINLNDIIDVNALFNSNVNDDMYFIYVGLDGSYFQELKVSYDEDFLRTYLFNELYDAVDSKKCCEVNTSIIDKLLLYDAFKLATSNRDKVYFWNLLHMTNVDTNSNCSCNG